MTPRNLNASWKKILNFKTSKPKNEPKDVPEMEDKQEIKKETEGFYSFITFDAEPTAPAEIESRLRIMENVLRYLIIRKDA